LFDSFNLVISRGILFCLLEISGSLVFFLFLIHLIFLQQGLKLLPLLLDPLIRFNAARVLAFCDLGARV